MMTRFFVALFLLSPVFLSAGNRPDAAASPADFVPHADPLPPLLAGQPDPVRFVLTETLRKIDEAPVLRLSSVEHRPGPHGFSAQTDFLRGEHACIRLESSLQTAAPGKLKVLAVSDGRTLAVRDQFENQKGNLVRTNLPSNSRVAMEFLASRGFAGPAGTIRELLELAEHTEMSAGTWKGQAVYRLQIDTTPEHPRMSAKKEARFRADQCLVYVDAQTWLPCRIEWHDRSRLVFEVDYRELRVDEKLTYDDCVRAFSMK